MDETTAAKGPPQFLSGEYVDIKSRGLTKETMAFFKCLATLDNSGNPVRVYQHVGENGNLVFQKLRTPDKKFPCIGPAKGARLYGQWLWQPNGKRVVVTEGEDDTHAVSQIQNHQWPVVSLPFGSKSAAEVFKAQFEWLNSFEEIVLSFDMDEPGRAAVEAVAGMFEPGKVKVVKLPLKDANDMLIAGRTDELRKALWQAAVWRPDGIINGDDITLEELLEDPVQGYSTPYPGLDEKLQGIRKRELLLVTAGSGIGKSTLVRELGHYFTVVHGLSIGNIYLEESYKKTAQGYLAIDNNVPLGELRKNPKLISPEQYKESMARVIHTGKTYFYDHFGSLDSDYLLAKMQYLAANGVDFIILDHISIVTSGQTSSREGERKDIDILMTRLRSLIEQTNVGVIAICHLSKADGQSHEEGGRVTLNSLRGSAALKQIPDSIIALERDQQGDTPDEADVRVLKNREHGDVGVCDRVKYDKQTGRLRSTAPAPVPVQQELVEEY